MGISLNGLTPAGTYPGLIKTGDNTAISGTPKVLSDGNGNDLPMEVSTTGVNFTNQLQQGGVAVPTASQVAAKQDTLVSGTNIKTINGASVLGSGNITTPNVSGVAGAIQFSNGSAFASDAANFFWDDANNRLGIGTNAPTATTHIKGVGTTNATTSFLVQNSAGSAILTITDDRTATFSGLGVYSSVGNFQNIRDISSNFNILSLNNANGDGTFNQRLGIGVAPTARVHIQGSGSTFATTSLLVQNSGGTDYLRVRDDGAFNRGSFYFISNSNIGDFLSGNDWNSYNLSNGSIKYRITGASFGFGISDAGYDTVAPSAMLQVNSTTKGFLPPRMTNAQRSSISSPAVGLMVYCTDAVEGLYVYKSTGWTLVI
jgi:hypothetical protein